MPWNVLICAATLMLLLLQPQTTFCKSNEDNSVAEIHKRNFAFDDVADFDDVFEPFEEGASSYGSSSGRTKKSLPSIMAESENDQAPSTSQVPDEAELLASKDLEGRAINERTAEHVTTLPSGCPTTTTNKCKTTTRRKCPTTRTTSKSTTTTTATTSATFPHKHTEKTTTDLFTNFTEEVVKEAQANVEPLNMKDMLKIEEMCDNETTTTTEGAVTRTLKSPHHPKHFKNFENHSYPKAQLALLETKASEDKVPENRATENGVSSSDASSSLNDFAVTEESTTASPLDFSSSSFLYPSIAESSSETVTWSLGDNNQKLTDISMQVGTTTDKSVQQALQDLKSALVSDFTKTASFTLQTETTVDPLVEDIGDEVKVRQGPTASLNQILAVSTVSVDVGVRATPYPLLDLAQESTSNEVKSARNSVDEILGKSQFAQETGSKYSLFDDPKSSYSETNPYLVQPRLQIVYSNPFSGFEPLKNKNYLLRPFNSDGQALPVTFREYLGNQRRKRDLLSAIHAGRQDHPKISENEIQAQNRIIPIADVSTTKQPLASEEHGIVERSDEDQTENAEAYLSNAYKLLDELKDFERKMLTKQVERVATEAEYLVRQPKSAATSEPEIIRNEQEIVRSPTLQVRQNPEPLQKVEDDSRDFQSLDQRGSQQQTRYDSPLNGQKPNNLDLLRRLEQLKSSLDVAVDQIRAESSMEPPPTSETSNVMATPLQNFYGPSTSPYYKNAPQHFGRIGPTAVASSDPAWWEDSFTIRSDPDIEPKASSSPPQFAARHKDLVGIKMSNEKRPRDDEYFYEIETPQKSRKASTKGRIRRNLAEDTDSHVESVRSKVREKFEALDLPTLQEILEHVYSIEVLLNSSSISSSGSDTATDSFALDYSHSQSASSESHLLEEYVERLKKVLAEAVGSDQAFQKLLMTESLRTANDVLEYARCNLVSSVNATSDSDQNQTPSFSWDENQNSEPDADLSECWMTKNSPKCILCVRGFNDLKFGSIKTSVTAPTTPGDSKSFKSLKDIAQYIAKENLKRQSKSSDANSSDSNASSQDVYPDENLNFLLYCLKPNDLSKILTLTTRTVPKTTETSTLSDLNMFLGPLPALSPWAKSPLNTPPHSITVSSTTITASPSVTIPTKKPFATLKLNCKKSTKTGSVYNKFSNSKSKILMQALADMKHKNHKKSKRKRVGKRSDNTETFSAIQVLSEMVDTSPSSAKDTLESLKLASPNKDEKKKQCEPKTTTTTTTIPTCPSIAELEKTTATNATSWLEFTLKIEQNATAITEEKNATEISWPEFALKDNPTVAAIDQAISSPDEALIDSRRKRALTYDTPPCCTILKSFPRKSTTQQTGMTQPLRQTSAAISPRKASDNAVNPSRISSAEETRTGTSAAQPDSEEGDQLKQLLSYNLAKDFYDYLGNYDDLQSLEDSTTGRMERLQRDLKVAYEIQDILDEIGSDVQLEGGFQDENGGLHDRKARSSNSSAVGKERHNPVNDEIVQRNQYLKKVADDVKGMYMPRLNWESNRIFDNPLDMLKARATSNNATNQGGRKLIRSSKYGGLEADQKQDKRFLFRRKKKKKKKKNKVWKKLFGLSNRIGRGLFENQPPKYHVGREIRSEKDEDDEVVTTSTTATTRKVFVTKPTGRIVKLRKPKKFKSKSNHDWAARATTKTDAKLLKTATPVFGNEWWFKGTSSLEGSSAEFSGIEETKSGNEDYENVVTKPTGRIVKLTWPGNKEKTTGGEFWGFTREPTKFSFDWKGFSRVTPSPFTPFELTNAAITFSVGPAPIPGSPEGISSSKGLSWNTAASPEVSGTGKGGTTIIVVDTNPEDVDYEADSGKPLTLEGPSTSEPLINLTGSIDLNNQSISAPISSTSVRSTDLVAEEKLTIADATQFTIIPSHVLQNLISTSEIEIEADNPEIEETSSSTVGQKSSSNTSAQPKQFSLTPAIVSSSENGTALAIDNNTTEEADYEAHTSKTLTAEEELLSSSTNLSIIATSYESTDFTSTTSKETIELETPSVLSNVTKLETESTSASATTETLKATIQTTSSELEIPTEAQSEVASWEISSLSETSTAKTLDTFSNEFGQVIPIPLEKLDENDEGSSTSNAKTLAELEGLGTSKKTVGVTENPLTGAEEFKITSESLSGINLELTSPEMLFTSILTTVEVLTSSELEDETVSSTPETDSSEESVEHLTSSETSPSVDILSKIEQTQAVNEDLESSKSPTELHMVTETETTSVIDSNKMFSEPASHSNTFSLIATEESQSKLSSGESKEESTASFSMSNLQLPSTVETEEERTLHFMNESTTEAEEKLFTIESGASITAVNISSQLHPTTPSILHVYTLKPETASEITTSSFSTQIGPEISQTIAEITTSSAELSEFYELSTSVTLTSFEVPQLTESVSESTVSTTEQSTASFQTSIELQTTSETASATASLASPSSAESETTLEEYIHEEFTSTETTVSETEGEALESTEFSEITFQTTESAPTVIPITAPTKETSPTMETTTVPSVISQQTSVSFSAQPTIVEELPEIEDLFAVSSSTTTEKILTPAEAAEEAKLTVSVSTESVVTLESTSNHSLQPELPPGVSLLQKEFYSKITTLDPAQIRHPNASARITAETSDEQYSPEDKGTTKVKETSPALTQLQELSPTSTQPPNIQISSPETPTEEFHDKIKTLEPSLIRYPNASRKSEGQTSPEGLLPTTEVEEFKPALPTFPIKELIDLEIEEQTSETSASSAASESSVSSGASESAGSSEPSRFSENSESSTSSGSPVLSESSESLKPTEKSTTISTETSNQISSEEETELKKSSSTSPTSLEIERTELEEGTSEYSSKPTEALQLTEEPLKTGTKTTSEATSSESETTAKPEETSSETSASLETESTELEDESSETSEALTSPQFSESSVELSNSVEVVSKVTTEQVSSTELTESSSPIYSALHTEESSESKQTSTESLQPSTYTSTLNEITTKGINEETSTVQMFSKKSEEVTSEFSTSPPTEIEEGLSSFPKLSKPESLSKTSAFTENLYDKIRTMEPSIIRHPNTSMTISTEMLTSTLEETQTTEHKKVSTKEKLTESELSFSIRSTSEVAPSDSIFFSKKETEEPSTSMKISSESSNKDNAAERNFTTKLETISSSSDVAELTSASSESFKLASTELSFNTSISEELYQYSSISTKTDTETSIEKTTTEPKSSFSISSTSSKEEITELEDTSLESSESSENSATTEDLLETHSYSSITFGTTEEFTSEKLTTLHSEISSDYSLASSTFEEELTELEEISSESPTTPELPFGTSATTEELYKHVSTSTEMSTKSTSEKPSSEGKSATETLDMLSSDSLEEEITELKESSEDSSGTELSTSELLTTNELHKYSETSFGSSVNKLNEQISLEGKSTEELQKVSSLTTSTSLEEKLAGSESITSSSPETSSIGRTSELSVTTETIYKYPNVSTRISSSELDEERTATKADMSSAFLEANQTWLDALSTTSSEASITQLGLSKTTEELQKHSTEISTNESKEEIAKKTKLTTKPESISSTVEIYSGQLSSMSSEASTEELTSEVSTTTEEFHESQNASTEINTKESSKQLEGRFTTKIEGLSSTDTSTLFEEELTELEGEESPESSFEGDVTKLGESYESSEEITYSEGERGTKSEMTFSTIAEGKLTLASSSVFSEASTAELSSAISLASKDFLGHSSTSLEVSSTKISGEKMHSEEKSQETPLLTTSTSPNVAQSKFEETSSQFSEPLSFESFEMSPITEELHRYSTSSTRIRTETSNEQISLEEKPVTGSKGISSVSPMNTGTETGHFESTSATELSPGIVSAAENVKTSESSLNVSTFITTEITGETQTTKISSVSSEEQQTELVPSVVSKSTEPLLLSEISLSSEELQKHLSSKSSSTEMASEEISSKITREGVPFESSSLKQIETATSESSSHSELFSGLPVTKIDFNKTVMVDHSLIGHSTTSVSTEEKEEEHEEDQEITSFAEESSTEIQKFSSSSFSTETTESNALSSESFFLKQIETSISDSSSHSELLPGLSVTTEILLNKTIIADHSAIGHQTVSVSTEEEEEENFIGGDSSTEHPSLSFSKGTLSGISAYTKVLQSLTTLSAFEVQNTPNLQLSNFSKSLHIITETLKVPTMESVSVTAATLSEIDDENESTKDSSLTEQSKAEEEEAAETTTKTELNSKEGEEETTSGTSEEISETTEIDIKNLATIFEETTSVTKFLNQSGVEPPVKYPNIEDSSQENLITANQNITESSNFTDYNVTSAYTEQSSSGATEVGDELNATSEEVLNEKIDSSIEHKINTETSSFTSSFPLSDFHTSTETPERETQLLSSHFSGPTETTEHYFTDRVSANVLDDSNSRSIIPTENTQESSGSQTKLTPADYTSQESSPVSITKHQETIRTTASLLKPSLRANDEELKHFSHAETSTICEACNATETLSDAEKKSSLVFGTISSISQFFSSLLPGTTENSTNLAVSKVESGGTTTVSSEITLEGLKGRDTTIQEIINMKTESTGTENGQDNRVLTVTRETASEESKSTEIAANMKQRSSEPVSHESISINPVSEETKTVSVLPKLSEQANEEELKHFSHHETSTICAICNATETIFDEGNKSEVSHSIVVTIKPTEIFNNEENKENTPVTTGAKSILTNPIQEISTNELIVNHTTENTGTSGENSKLQQTVSDLYVSSTQSENFDSENRTISETSLKSTDHTFTNTETGTETIPQQKLDSSSLSALHYYTASASEASQLSTFQRSATADNAQKQTPSEKPHTSTLKASEQANEEDLKHFSRHETSTICEICNATEKYGESSTAATKASSVKFSGSTAKPSEGANEEDLKHFPLHETSTVCEICNVTEGLTETAYKTSQIPFITESTVETVISVAEKSTHGTGHLSSSEISVESTKKGVKSTEILVPTHVSTESHMKSTEVFQRETEKSSIAITEHSSVISTSVESTLFSNIISSVEKQVTESHTQSTVLMENEMLKTSEKLASFEKNHTLLVGSYGTSQELTTEIVEGTKSEGQSGVTHEFATEGSVVVSHGASTGESALVSQTEGSTEVTHQQLTEVTHKTEVEKSTESSREQGVAEHTQSSAHEIINGESTQLTKAEGPTEVTYGTEIKESSQVTLATSAKESTTIVQGSKIDGPPEITHVIGVEESTIISHGTAIKESTQVIHEEITQVTHEEITGVTHKTEAEKSTVFHETGKTESTQTAHESLTGEKTQRTTVEGLTEVTHATSAEELTPIIQETKTEGSFEITHAIGAEESIQVSHEEITQVTHEEVTGVTNEEITGITHKTEPEKSTVFHETGKTESTQMAHESLTGEKTQGTRVEGLTEVTHATSAKELTSIIQETKIEGSSGITHTIGAEESSEVPHETRVGTHITQETRTETHKTGAEELTESPHRKPESTQITGEQTQGTTVEGSIEVTHAISAEQSTEEVNQISARISSEEHTEITHAIGASKSSARGIEATEITHGLSTKESTEGLQGTITLKSTESESSGSDLSTSFTSNAHQLSSEPLATQTVEGPALESHSEESSEKLASPASPENELTSPSTSNLPENVSVTSSFGPPESNHSSTAEQTLSKYANQTSMNQQTFYTNKPAQITLPTHLRTEISHSISSTHGPIYISLPVYLKNSTASVESFEKYYTVATSSTFSPTIYDDEATDCVIDKEAFRSMRFSDFEIITEFPPSTEEKTQSYRTCSALHHGKHSTKPAQFEETGSSVSSGFISGTESISKITETNVETESASGIMELSREMAELSSKAMESSFASVESTSRASEVTSTSLEVSSKKMEGSSTSMESTSKAIEVNFTSMESPSKVSEANFTSMEASSASTNASSNEMEVASKEFGSTAIQMGSSYKHATEKLEGNLTTELPTANFSLVVEVKTTTVKSLKEMLTLPNLSLLHSSSSEPTSTAENATQTSNATIPLNVTVSIPILATTEAGPNSTCSMADFLTHNHCICSVDNLIKDLRRKLSQNMFVANADQYSCPLLTDVEVGIVLGNDSVPRSTRYGREDDENVQKREVIENSKIEKVLGEELQMKNSERETFATPGMKIQVPCLYGDDSTLQAEVTNYSWTLGDNLPLTEGKTGEQEGNLVIEAISSQDGGNYTCVATSGVGTSVISKKFEHHLTIVSIPTYTISTAILYNASQKCNAEDVDMVALFLPSALENLICGNFFKICNIVMRDVRCVNESHNHISANFSTSVEPMNVIMPSLNTSICDVNCEMQAYSKILQFVVKNLENVQRLPVFFRLSYRQEKLSPTEVVAYKGKSRPGTTAPRLVIACPPGFGYLKQTHICGACIRNTFSRGHETYCTPCPAGQFQPMTGSKSCLTCSSPLQDPFCLRVVYSNSRKFEIWIGILAAVLILKVGILVYIRNRKKQAVDEDKNTKFDKSDYRSGKKYFRRRSRDVDVEKQDTRPLLDRSRDRKVKSNRKPPEPPPPDFL